MNCNTTHYRANSSSVPGDPTEIASINATRVSCADEPAATVEIVHASDAPEFEPALDADIALTAPKDGGPGSATPDELAVAEGAATTPDLAVFVPDTSPVAAVGLHYSASSRVVAALAQELALPPDLISFEEFQKTHWITPQGTCQEAPWLNVAAFGEAISDGCLSALQAEQFGRAMVFAAAAKQVGWTGTPTPDEVETWARLWMKPRDAVGLGIDGVLQLRLAAGEGRLDSAWIWKLRLCLEALRPSRDLPLAHGEEDEWLDVIGFRSGALRQMLELLLRVGRATDRPTDDVRRVLKESGSRLDTLTSALAAARKEFHVEVRRLWNGAGGKIERSHCRHAWDEFISRIRPILETLYPPTEGGEEWWDADDVGRKVARFERVHKDIADNAKAKFHDRHKMDRAARSIAEMSARINELYRRVRAANEGRRAQQVSDEDMAKKAETLLAEHQLSDRFEGLCRQLIVRQFELQVAAHSMTGLSASDLIEYPALLGCIATASGLISGQDDSEVVPIAATGGQHCTDARRSSR